jgi:uncharacterized phage-associated protein
MRKGATRVLCNWGETKLHKLLFICDGYLCACGVNIISEHARAWNYGPVYPKIHKWLSRVPGLEDMRDDCSPATLKELSDIGAEPLVDRVIETYGHMSAQSLSMWTHKPGSPWEKALERGRGVMNSVIDKNDMADYFKGLLRETV